MAVDVIVVLETMFIAGDNVLYLMRNQHKATQRRANCVHYCFKSVHKKEVTHSYVTD
jgi:hypothetical protein